MIISIQSNNRRYFAKQSTKRPCRNSQKKLQIARNLDRERKIASRRSLGGASFSFRSNFHERKRELKPGKRDGRSYFLRQALRALVTRS